MRCRPVMSTEILPDDVILEIFDFYMGGDQKTNEGIEVWQSLVHVCQRWRRIVFGSPRRLNLRLVCSPESQAPLRHTLDVWPALPLLIVGTVNRLEDLYNIIAALERSDRVYDINVRINFPISILERFWTAMQQPFPELTILSLRLSSATTVVPDSFLGGSAPHLRFLMLEGISFPGLPKLLLSVTRLDDLHLYDIPHSGYFSPEEIVTALSTLTSLRSLSLEFQSPRSVPRRRLPPMKRSVFPALKSLRFKGVSEYLELLVARIDTPRLGSLGITLFNQIVFDTPQTTQFISRTPSLNAPGEARLAFDSYAAEVRLSSQTPGFGQIFVRILCKEFDWQISSLEQVCTSSLPPLFALENLYLREEGHPNWKENVENTLWLELLHPFFAVKNLHLSERLELLIGPALRELDGGRTTEVLPALQNITLERLRPSGPVHEGIAKFIAARQLPSHPITISVRKSASSWDTPMMKIPDIILLKIFDQVLLIEDRPTKKAIEAWQSLVHVCQQWRRVVFGSPRQLNLRLFCTPRTPARDMLDVWPALPLIVEGSANRPEELYNIIAALERSDRAYDIELRDVSSSHLENILTAMQKPFPELTYLSLQSSEETKVIPESFLGGSAPCLRELWLDGIQFPGLLRLLLSATHLVNLGLLHIPHSGYISPETIVTALSTLTELEFLVLEFQFPLSSPDWETRLPPLTHSVLPSLAALTFIGTSKYLEDLVTRIHAPLLYSLDITLFDQIVFDTPETNRFINRTSSLRTLDVARLKFRGDSASVLLSTRSYREKIFVKVPCREFDQQISSLERVCSSSSPPYSALVDLYIYEDVFSPPDWKDDIENTLWLELLRPFSAVKNLYLSQKFSPRIAHALQELVAGRTTEVLPSLENIILEELQLPGPEGIVEFVAARQLSGHPITVSLWARDPFESGPESESESESTVSEADDSLL